MLHAPVFIGTGDQHETRCQILLCAFGHFVCLATAVVCSSRCPYMCAHSTCCGYFGLSCCSSRLVIATLIFNTMC